MQFLLDLCLGLVVFAVIPKKTVEMFDENQQNYFVQHHAYSTVQ